MMGIDTVIGLAGIAVAVPGLVQTSMHAGRWLSKKIQSAPASPEIAQMQDFLLDLNRGSLRTTLETVEDLYFDSPDTKIKSNLQHSAEQLWVHMIELEKNIDNLRSSVCNDKQVKKATDTALVSISSIRRLEARLMQYVQTEVASKVLKSRMELRSHQFKLVGPVLQVANSTAKTALADFSLQDRQRSETYIIEDKTFPGLPYSQAYEEAVWLARMLRFFRNSDGLPELAGFQVQAMSPLTDTLFRFTFSLPQGRTNLRSLRDILIDPINKPVPAIPRNYRFILPRKLAEAVYHVHQQNLVHKCIRPESILLLEPADDGSPKMSYPKIIGAPYLVDWQYTRKTIGASRREAYDNWTMAIYQHPERQAHPGDVAATKYNIGHDIYSLGVLFLEIGLWDSFVLPDDQNGTLCRTFSEAKQIWKNDNIGVAQSMTDSQIEQKVFITLAGDRLAYEMGEAYSKLVIKCLTCMEKGFGNVLKFVDSTSRDWDDQGILFIQEIRKELIEASTMGSGIYNRIT